LALRIDGSSEDELKAQIKTYKQEAFRHIDFHGEESLRNPNLDLAKGLKAGCEVCALADAVDGTDLVERGLFNWCSDVVFFAPREPEGNRVLASVVTLPNGDSYFANRSNEGAYVLRKSRSKRAEQISRISSCTSLCNASICFYGQQINHLCAVSATGLFKYIKELEPEKIEAVRELVGSKGSSENKCRIYNLAGVPMMMKLIDPICHEAHGIDAVFDVAGQKPHDVVPGAYIALKAGACMRKIDGTTLSLADLENALLRPADQRLKYVLTGTAALCDEMIQAFGLQDKKLVNNASTGT
jgi:fructose-1,6-bisphosphatase/inositol monophosphatase family enzyme